VRTGRLERQYRSGYRIAGAPHSWRGDLIAACLAGGDRAVASHRSAAALWNLAGGRTDMIEITCPRWRRTKNDGLVVHESSAPMTGDTMAIDGIPVTSPAMTLLMLGAVCTPLVVEQALDKVIRLELATYESVAALVRRVGRQGRDGAGVLRAMLRARDPNRAPCDSEKETQLFALLRTHGLPLPTPQYEIFHCGRFIARPDFVYVDARLVIEYDSYQEHEGKVALDHDAARRNDLMSAGWPVLSVTQAAIRAGGHQLCRQIRNHLSKQGHRAA
jgi:very-short-patch-repair endonuclease